MKRIFITGGNSFLGHSLLSLLDGLDFWAPPSKEVNLLNSVQLEEAICKYKPNIILHMAANCGGILKNSKHPADFIRDNISMGINIFECARKFNIPKVYTLGSVCCYPLHTEIPFKEDDIWKEYPEPTNAPYGIAKRVIMVFGQTYRKQYGIGGAHLIPSNLYGIFDHFDLIDSHVIPALINKFCNATENNLPTVECWGSGEATREFLYVQDLAKAIIKAITSDLDTPLPINIGTGRDISIKDLAHLIAQLTGFEGKIVFTGEVSDGQPKRRLDVSRAKELLEFEAKTSLLEGLSRTIDWYQTTKKEV